jgi:hypothetical protein
MTLSRRRSDTNCAGAWWGNYHGAGAGTRQASCGACFHLFEAPTSCKLLLPPIVCSKQINVSTCHAPRRFPIGPESVGLPSITLHCVLGRALLGPTRGQWPIVTPNANHFHVISSSLEKYSHRHNQFCIFLHVHTSQQESGICREYSQIAGLANVISDSAWWSLIAERGVQTIHLQHPCQSDAVGYIRRRRLTEDRTLKQLFSCFLSHFHSRRHAYLSEACAGKGRGEAHLFLRVLPTQDSTGMLFPHGLDNGRLTASRVFKTSTTAWTACMASVLSSLTSPGALVAATPS